MFFHAGQWTLRSVERHRPHHHHHLLHELPATQWQRPPLHHVQRPVQGEDGAVVHHAELLHQLLALAVNHVVGGQRQRAENIYKNYFPPVWCPLSYLYLFSSWSGPRTQYLSWGSRGSTESAWKAVRSVLTLLMAIRLLVAGERLYELRNRELTWCSFLKQTTKLFPL